nr:zinc finger, CCHC-type, retrotransposon Gag domain protein [Tanacetum cinerariifolium]
MGVTRETRVSSPTDMPILVFSSPGVPLRATTTWSALCVDADTQESVVELLRGVTIMVSEPGYETVGSKDLTCEDWMVNTRTDADLSATVQNALQTLLPQIRVEIREEFRTSSGPSDSGENPPPTLLPLIRVEIREEFRTSSGPSDSGGNPPSVTIHTWLERFNKQKPRSFEKATAPVDAENWISHMEKIFDVMGCEDAFKTRLAVYKFEGNALAWWKAYKQGKGGDALLITVTWAEFKKLFFLQFFPRAEQERLKREYHSIRQTNTETSTEFMQRFLRLAGFLGAAAGTEEEQAKNFQWGLRRSTLNHLMCMSYTDVAQVANAARNYEILDERDDDDAERPDKRQKSGDWHQPTFQQSSHRNHGHSKPSWIRQASRHLLIMGVTRETGVSSPTDLPILVLSSPGVPLRATPTRFALRVDADTQESVVELLQRACAFVTYTTREAAEKATDELSNKLVVKGL